VTGEQGAHTRANGDTGAGAAVAVAVVMVVVVVVVRGGGATRAGAERYLVRSKPPHPLSARLVAAEELGHLLEQRLRVGGPR
jgi:hypothetical protein